MEKKSVIPTQLIIIKELSTDGATTNMNRENKVNEINQSQKTIYGMIPFIGTIQNRQIYRNRK